MKKIVSMLLAVALCLGIMSIVLADAASNQEAAAKAASMSFDELLAAAKGEGQIYSVGMPDEWANYKDFWAKLRELGVNTSDTDMSSSEELAQFALQGKANADIGDIGLAMTGVAVEQGLLLPFKTSHWDSIPDWAKDEEGKWIEAYTCTTAFITDLQNVEKAPGSWKELLEGDYKVTIGDVEKAAQAYYAVLACNVALGGDETDLTPALEAFAKLAEEGRLNTSNPYVSNLENGEIEVAVVWDFNALGYRDQIDASRFAVSIPTDGAVTSGYASVINQYANNPYAAMLAREVLLSEEGQNFLAVGYARPIREDIQLTDEAKAHVLDSALYVNAYKIPNLAAWDKTVSELPTRWAEEVAVNMG